MTLAEWLKIPNADGSRKRKYALAAAIGVTPTMITEYAEGRTWPGRDKIESIVRETDGAVTANDFLSEVAQATVRAASEASPEPAQ